MPDDGTVDTSTQTTTSNGAPEAPSTPADWRKLPDAQRVLSSQGDRIKALEAQIAEAAQAEAERKAAADEAEQKRLAEQGEYKTIAERNAAKAAELEAQLAAKDERIAAFEKREKKRVESVAAANTERLEKLPESLRELVPAGLDPDAASQQIAKLEGLVTSDGGATKAPDPGFARRNTTAPDASYTPEAQRAASLDWMLGKRDGDSK